MKKYSITIKGHRTSISLEEAFWFGLESAAAAEGISRVNLITKIDKARKAQGLSSACRLYVLNFYQTATAPHSAKSRCD